MAGWVVELPPSGLFCSFGDVLGELAGILTGSITPSRELPPISGSSGMVSAGLMLPVGDSMGTAVSGGVVLSGGMAVSGVTVSGVRGVVGVGVSGAAGLLLVGVSGGVFAGVVPLTPVGAVGVGSTVRGLGPIGVCSVGELEGFTPAGAAGVAVVGVGVWAGIIGPGGALLGAPLFPPGTVVAGAEAPLPVAGSAGVAGPFGTPPGG